jgi:hypothetical protein
VAMDMVTHRFNDRIREDLARIGANKARLDAQAATAGDDGQSAATSDENPPAAAGDTHLAPA